MAKEDIQALNRTELWGTFSVRDHLRPRAFVTEVLLYDRLVIPRPPTLDEERPKPGEQSQLERWAANGWKPDRLDQLLDVMREHDLTIELPWGEQARDDWKKLYDGANLPEIGAQRATILQMAKEDIRVAKEQMPNQAAYVATGGLLQTYVANELQHQVAQRLTALAKTPGVPVEPVIAYASYGAFQHEQSVKDRDLAPDTANAYALLGWDFFIPEDTDKSDIEMLRITCKLAARKDLREHRQSFHDWLRQMHEGRIDPETAAKDMKERLDAYRKIASGSGLGNSIKPVARFVAKTAPVSGPILAVLGHYFGIPDVANLWAGLAGAGVPLILQPLSRESRPDERVRPAALVHDIRQAFGKK
jgi:hypothetical protein